MSFQRRFIPSTTKEIDVRELIGDVFLIPPIFLKDGVIKSAEAAKIGEAAKTEEAAWKEENLPASKIIVNRRSGMG
jgi:hypothetical protein